MHLEVKEGVKHAHKAFIALKENMAGESKTKTGKCTDDSENILEVLGEMEKRMAKTEESVRN